MKRTITLFVGLCLTFGFVSLSGCGGRPAPPPPEEGDVDLTEEPDVTTMEVDEGDE